MDLHPCTAAPQPTPLAALACLWMSAALQSDYLYNGRGARPGQRHPPSRRAQPKPGPKADLHVEPEATADAADEMASCGGRDITGAYLAQMRSRARLSSSEEYRLALRAARGDHEAASRLVEHNLGFVVMIARRYAGGRVPLLDLIQEGNIALLKACAKFDPEMGYRLSTYAKWWVREAIETAVLTQSTAVRLPVHAAKKLRQSRKAGTAGRPAAQDAPPLHCLLVDASDGSHDAGPADVEDQAIDRLQAPADEEPHERLQQVKRLDRMLQALECLKPLEQLVLTQRFGLDGEEPRTLHQVAAPLSLSHERIRQIEAEALARLRSVFRERGLASAAML